MATFKDLNADVLHIISCLLCAHCHGRRGENSVPYDEKEWKEDQKALMSFSRTCKQVHAVARKIVYHSIYLGFDELALGIFDEPHVVYDARLRTLERRRGLCERTLINSVYYDADAKRPRPPQRRVVGSETHRIAAAVQHIQLNFGDTSYSRRYGADALRKLLHYCNVQHLELVTRTRLNLFYAPRNRPHDTYPSIHKIALVYGTNGIISNRLGALWEIGPTLLDRCTNLTELHIHGVAFFGVESVTFRNVTTLRFTNCRIREAHLYKILPQFPKLETFVFARGKVRINQTRSELSFGAGGHGHWWEQFTPRKAVMKLKEHQGAVLKRLELGPFYNWEGFANYELNGIYPLSKAGEVATAVIGTADDGLHGFGKLENIQLCQDAILGPYCLKYSDVPDGSSFVRRVTGPLLGDHDGGKLVKILPGTIKSLRINYVNEELSRSLLHFARSVGMFPNLEEVYLHGEDPRLKLVCANADEGPKREWFPESPWRHMTRGSLEDVGNALRARGIRFGFEAMENA